MLDARRLTMAGYGPLVSVTVAADGHFIRLTVDGASYPAGLQPAQARYLANKLLHLARLIEGRTP